MTNQRIKNTMKIIFILSIVLTIIIIVLSFINNVEQTHTESLVSASDRSTAENLHSVYPHLINTDLNNKNDLEFKIPRISSDIEVYEMSVDEDKPLIIKSMFYEETYDTLYIDYQNKLSPNEYLFTAPPIIFKAIISSNLPKFCFKIMGDSVDDYFDAKFIEIWKEGDSIVNQIAKIPFCLYYDLNKVVVLDRTFEVVDMNFDGYKDIRLIHNAGVTGNNQYNAWLYSKTTGNFVYSDVLTYLSTAKFDTANKIIKTHNREGGPYQEVNFYKYFGNSLKKVTTIYSQMAGDKYLRTTVRLINNKMIVVLEDFHYYQLSHEEELGIHYE